MDHGFDELKELLRNSEERMRALETKEAGCQPLVNGRIDAAWREIDAHRVSIKDISGKVESQERAIEVLQQSNNLMKWIAGIAGSALIGWLILQILNLVGT